MKKFLIVVVSTIFLLVLLTLTLLPQPESPILQGTTQSVPDGPFDPTSQNTSQQRTAQPTPPQNVPFNTSRNPQQTSPQPNPPIDKQPTNRTLQEAIGNATHYLTQTQEPYALLLLDVLYRRFGITEFADSLQRYDQLLTYNPENAPLLRIFRRIADYYSPVEPMDFYAVTADVDKITVPALYSDRLSPSEDYVSKLGNAANSGGYLLTHALLATIWLQDNHCDMPNVFTDSLYYANARLVGNDSVVNDLEIEAAAFLYAAGQGKLVDDAFVQRVVAVQNGDGGWLRSSDSPENSYWHSTVLGLMLLLHAENSSDSYPPMLAPALS